MKSPADVSALARAGAQVLNPGSVELAMENNVEQLVLSSAGESGRTAAHRLGSACRPDFAGVTRSAGEPEPATTELDLYAVHLQQRFDDVAELFRGLGALICFIVSVSPPPVRVVLEH